MNKPDPIHSEDIREQLEDYFYQALEVELLLRLFPDDEDTICQIVDLLVDTCATKRRMLRIAGDDKPAEVVRSRLKKLNADHIRFVLNSLAEEVMEMCHREGLYQIDLLSGSKERITEREYWAAKKGQLALDKENAAREAAGQPTKPTKFETDKAKLRRTIRQALSQAGSFDEFSSLLLREGVTVKESRGRLSYLTPDRTKPITARKLGDDFDKAAVLALLTQNARRAAEQTKAIPEYPVAVKKPSQGEKTTKTTPADNTLQRMVDREAKRAEGKGVGYDRWAAKHNLKQMAATVTAYQQYGFSSPEELDEACSAAYAAMQESLTELKQVEKTLNGKKELQRQVLAYSKTRPVRDGLKQQKNAKAKAAYRQKYESDFIIADAAARYFRENGISKLPSYKALQAEIETLIQEKNSGYNDYRAKREEYRRLQTVKGNIDQILHRERKPVKRQEQER